jgi:hypothetical protein
MADRIGAVGGTLTVESGPGRGTSVRASVPLPAASLSRDATPGAPLDADVDSDADVDADDVVRSATRIATAADADPTLVGGAGLP